VFSATSVPPVVTSYEEAIERARSLGPVLRERIPQTEQLRRLPDETVADLLESGLVGLMTPRRFGGSELGAEAMIDVTVELGASCPSTGWVYMLWTAHMWMLALFPPQAQEELWANPNTLASSVVSTIGEVVPAPGGYRFKGRGLFSSGVDHCNWLTAAVPIKRDGDDQPQRRWLLIPREDFEIVDDWYTVGLRGTGSKTVLFEDVFIPEYRSLANVDAEQGTAPGIQLNDHPMYCGISVANFTAAMAAPAVGVARGFLHAFEDRLRPRVGGGDVAVNSPYAAAGIVTTLARYAAAAAEVDAVHALTLQNAVRYSTVPARNVSQEARGRCRRDQAFTAQMARRAVNTLYEECGGTGLLESSDLQRLWRDANAAAAHRGLTWDWLAQDWPLAVLSGPRLSEPGPS
jgi:3-hydroxy-9,10-secoandrosta-1,3,5(10)-triene-9,17-dione monooxygenase